MSVGGRKWGPGDSRGQGAPGERGRGERGRGEPRKPVVADRADYDPDFDPGAPIPCEVCGGVMVYAAACKLKCGRCGYARDCSDP